MTTNYVEYVQSVEETQHSTDLEGNPVTYYEVDQTVWWAIKPNDDQYKVWKEGDEEPEFNSDHRYTSYRINGSSDVRIFDKRDLEGIRGLLNEIEKHLDK